MRKKSKIFPGKVEEKRKRKGLLGRCLWNQSLVIKQRREMLFSCLGMKIKIKKYSWEKYCREKKALWRVTKNMKIKRERCRAHVSK